MNDITRLLSALAQPAAYPFAVDEVVVRQTHISMVFLAGAFVYKVKKPVRLGFLDFSTLERRKHFCEEEVRLNRRLAPRVYLGVVPISEQKGGLRVEGAGSALEWAVKMRRLPGEATLEQRLRAGAVAPEHLSVLAGRLARFHADTAAGPPIASFGTFDIVARNCRENFDQTRAHVGITVRDKVWQRVRALTEDALTQLQTIIAGRAQRGVPRDTHGDLHLDHVYHFPDETPPDDWVIIDCIEFNERFRYADPIADVAFLVMDLKLHGWRDLGQHLIDAYIEASGDREGRAVLRLYTAYRAVVRAKVEGLKLLEQEIPPGERESALRRAQAHWLVALGELEMAARRPCLVLVSGLPGTGKSSLAAGLTQVEGGSFAVLRSDVVRKELADVEEGRLHDSFYTPEWNARVYDELGRRAAALLEQGGRVIIDANFREERQRQRFIDVAFRWGVPAVMLHCRASEAVVRERLQQRRGDVSDADWQTYQQLAATWQPPGEDVQRRLVTIDADRPRAEVIVQATTALADQGVL